MPDGSVVGGASRSSAQVVRLPQSTRNFPDGSPAVEILEGLFWNKDRAGPLYRRGASLEELLAEAGGEEASALLAVAEEARQKIIAAGGKAPRRREKQFIPLKFAPYPVRAERIVIDEGAEPGRRAEGLEYSLALDSLSGEPRRCRISLKDMTLAGELSAALGGLPGCIKGAGLDRQINIILAQRGQFEIPIVSRPATSGFSKKTDGAPRYVSPDRIKQTVLINGVPHIVDEDGTAEPDIIDYERLDSETEALGAAEVTADSLHRLALLRGSHYRGLVASLVPLGTFTALVGAPGSDPSRTGETGAGKTLSAKHAAALPLSGQVNFRFSGLSKAGLEARLRGLRDGTIVGDDFNWSDHGSPAERQRINELVGMVGRAAYDGSEMRGLSTRDNRARRGVEVRGHMLLTGERFDPDAGLQRRMVLFRYRQGECNWPGFIAEWDRWRTVHDDTSRAIIHYVLRQLATPEGEAELVALIAELDDAVWLETRLAARFPAFDRGVLRDIATNYAKGVSGLRLAAFVRSGELETAELEAARDAAEHHAASLIDETRNTAVRDVDETVLRDFIRWALHGHAYLFDWETGRQLEAGDPRIADCGYRPSPGEAGAWVTNGGTRLGWIKENDDVLFNGPAGHSLLQAYARVTRIPLELPAAKLADLFVRLQLAEPDLLSGRNTQVHRVGGIKERGVFIPADRDIFDRLEAVPAVPAVPASNNQLNIKPFPGTADSDRAVPAVPAAVPGKTAYISALEHTGTAGTAGTASFAPFVPPTAPTAWAKRPRSELGNELMGWGKLRGYPLLRLQAGARGGRDTVLPGVDEWRLFARLAAPDELAAALRAAQLSPGNAEGFSSATALDVAEDSGATDETATQVQAETPLPAAPEGAGCAEAGRTGLGSQNETGASTGSAEALAPERPEQEGARARAGVGVITPTARAGETLRVSAHVRAREAFVASPPFGGSKRRENVLASLGAEGLLIEGRGRVSCKLPDPSYAGILASPIVERHGVTQLWLPEREWCMSVKLPDKLLPPQGARPDWQPYNGMPHPAAAAPLPEGWRLKGGPGLLPWAGFEHTDGREVAIVIPHFGLGGSDPFGEPPRDGVPLTASLCLEALTAFRRATGFVYRVSPPTMLRIITDRLHGGGGALPLDFPELPEGFPSELFRYRAVARDIGWSRPLLPAEREGIVQGYDVNGMYLGAMSGAIVGYGQPAHYQKPDFAGRVERRAGWWRAIVSLPKGWPPDLPDPRFLRGEDHGRPEWYTTVWLAYLAELGCGIDVAEAWLFAEAHRPYDAVYRRLRQARGGLSLAAGKPAPAPLSGHTYPSYDGISREALLLALDLVKATYTAGTGNMSRRQPYSAQAIISRARVNMFRHIMRSELRPFGIRTDALYLAGAEPDPIIAAGTLPLDPQLGHFKTMPEICGMPLASWLPAIEDRRPTIRELDGLKKLGRKYHGGT